MNALFWAMRDDETLVSGFSQQKSPAFVSYQKGGPKPKTKGPQRRRIGIACHILKVRPNAAVQGTTLIGASLQPLVNLLIAH